MKKFQVLFMTVLFSTPSLTVAECSKEVVSSELSRQGYSYEFLRTDNDGDNFFRLRKDGSSFSLKVETDGDVSLSKFYQNSGFTNDDTARVMESIKYLQVYVDSDGDVAMQYHVAQWGESRCNFDMSSNIRMFMQLTDTAERRLQDES